MRHKKNKDPGSKGVNLSIIVVPMLDMSFQLLSFFIMVYSPNAAEEFIGGELGRTKAAAPKDAAVAGPLDKSMPKDPTKIPIKDIDPKLEQSFTVVLTTVDPRSKGGAIKPSATREGEKPNFIQIKSPANALDKEASRDADNLLDMATFVKEDLAFKTLEATLRKYHREITMTKEKGEAKTEKKDEVGAIKTAIRIEADRGIQFNYVIQVFAACKRAGFDDVTFTTPLD